MNDRVTGETLRQLGVSIHTSPACAVNFDPLIIPSLISSGARWNAAFEKSLDMQDLNPRKIIDYNVINIDFDLALASALAYGQADCVAALLSRKISQVRLKRNTRGGRVALNVVAGKGLSYAVRYWLAPDVNERLIEMVSDETDLWAACAYQCWPAVDLLLRKPLPMSWSVGPTSALHISATLSPSLEIIQRMIERGANINARAAEQNTLLHFAVRNTSKDIIAYLLTLEDPDINECDLHGYTPLDLAVCADRADMIELLVLGGAKVNKMKDQISYAPTSGLIASLDQAVGVAWSDQELTEAMQVAVQANDDSCVALLRESIFRRSSTNEGKQGSESDLIDSYMEDQALE
ncbi:Hypothetical protein D9617_7g029480 [Elsinoe fawcettii]|nr:Hypothetical protein D9617_7g029480 [Elsinoe fawcettii]